MIGRRLVRVLSLSALAGLGGLTGLAATPASAQLKGDHAVGRGGLPEPPRGGAKPKRSKLEPGPELLPPYTVDSAPFRVLDTVVGNTFNLNNVPYSPIAVSQGGLYTAVVNPHANIVRVFDSADPNPVNWTLHSTFKTAWGPSSVAFWQNANCQGELLVTCSNTDALLWLSNNGRVHGLLGLPGEPSDLLVDAVRNRAFVSCLSADVVVEIDLFEKRITRKFPIPSKHPAFLAFEAGGTGHVVVAPMHSGNNTTVERGPAIFQAGPNGILDLSTATKGLPDEDLFRLRIDTGEIEPLVVHAGTILFDHGRNPATGDWWMLGTDAHNFALQNEHEAKGVFSENRLAIVTLPTSGAPATPGTVVNLDDSDRVTPGVQYDPTKTVGQPYALAFDSAGNGFVAGMLTDNVTMLDSAGNFVKEWNVGSIPRGLKVIQKGANEFLAVFCWGSNEVQIYLPAVGTGRVVTLNLGPDPLPAAIQAGRKHYYSAANSQHNNLSCNTCHVDGFSDLLAWDLSDRRKDSGGAYTVPVDDKGPLVTQTLRAIFGQSPYHWRGERADLIDFNGAFASLLGGTKLDETPGGAFNQFQAFVFSLQERANPHESRRRRVSDKIIPPTIAKSASAVRGQDIFWDLPSLNGLTCQDCHALPSGTNNDMFRDEPDAPTANRSHFKTAPLMSFWRKLQPTRVKIQYSNGDTDTVPVLGVGLSATGLADDVVDFVLKADFNLLSELSKHDVAAFLQQIDTGVPPLMHEGIRIGYGASCTGSTPLSGPPPSGPLGGGPLGGGPLGGSLGVPFGAQPLQAVGTVVAPPGTSADAVAELETNVEDILVLTSRADADALDLVVVAELNGAPVDGTFDPQTGSFALSDGVAVNANFDKTQFFDALVTEELVGMLFSMPLGLGTEFSELDPFDNDGKPYVEPGPGPTSPVDPDDDGDGDPGIGSQLVVSPDSGRPEQDGDVAAAAAARGPGDLPTHASGTGPVISDFQVVYATTRVAKLVFFTDQPARSTTVYTPQGGAPRTQSDPAMRTAHQVFLRDLDPSLVWDLQLTVTGGGGGMSQLIVPTAFQSRPLLAPGDVVVSSLSNQAPTQDSGGVLTFTTDLVVDHKGGAAAWNHTPVLDVLVYNSVNDFWRVDQQGLLAPGTDAAGASSLPISVAGLAANDLVMVRVADVQAPDTLNYVWSLADTAPGDRLVEVVYTGTGP